MRHTSNKDYWFGVTGQTDHNKQRAAWLGQ
jgi:hypothetical protein